MEDTFLAIREYERLLYKGVPEQWEPVWQRESFSNFNKRETGKDIFGSKAKNKQVRKYTAKLILTPDSLTVVKPD